MKIQLYLTKLFSSLLSISGKKPTSTLSGEKKEHFPLNQGADYFASWHL